MSASPARRSLLARLHCIRKEQGWDEDTYRAILESRTGRRSAGDMDDRTIARLIASLAPATGATKAPPRRQHEWSWVDTAAADRKPLLRKLIMLMKGTTVPRGRQVRYIEGVARQMSGLAAPIAKPLAMCDRHELWRLVQAVAVHVKRHGGDPDAV